MEFQADGQCKIMSDKTKLLLKIAAILVAIFLLGLQAKRIKALQSEKDRYQNNTNALLSDIKTYKVRDSLNAARIETLELTIREFERFRAEDASIIKELKSRNTELKSINKAQEQTILKLSSIPKDTIVIIDSIPIPAKSVECGDYWYTFKGVLTDKTFEGTLENRDSILIAESVRYKRFLFFKTKRVKFREVNAVSLNPHTKIIGMEYIVIEK